jgi:hypothetical protein
MRASFGKLQLVVLGTSAVLLAGVLAGCGSDDGSSVALRKQPSLLTPSGAITGAADDLRTGWYPNQPNLDPLIVGSPRFGRMWRTNLPLTPGEQVYAQPLVVNGTVFIATEANNIYSLDGETGAILASRNVGLAWDAANIGCADLLGTIGITGTPVIDSAANTVYFLSKQYLGAPSADYDNVGWFAHAVDASTLAERPNFPVRIQGTASNAPARTFQAFTSHQRPGLLLLDGVVYAGFGAHCDSGDDWRGWVVGIKTNGQIQSLFTTVGDSGFPKGGGIWQSGSGLMSDGSGRVFFATGNAFTTEDDTARSTPPSKLHQSVVRLQLQGDGTTPAADFFTPFDRNDLDVHDTDFGSGGPVALPTPYFGTPTYPNLLVMGGKAGIIFVMNRNHLGGFKQGPGGGNDVVSTVTAPSGMWSRPAVWPGDGGYIYVSGNHAPMKAYRYGIDASGLPVFTEAGHTPKTQDAGSGSPIVTSSGTASGSALVWVVFSHGGFGGPQLRAFDALPDAAGNLVLRFEDLYQTEAKFSVPGVGEGRLYLGTADGSVLAYGAPLSSPVTAPATDFGTVTVGSSNTVAVTVTANQNVTVTGFSAGPGFTVGTATPPLPATLAKDASMTVPVTFSPTAVQTYAVSLNITTTAGAASGALHGVGRAAGPQLAVSPSSVNFGTLSSGSSNTVNVLLSNTGSMPLTWNGFTQPTAPFSGSNLPTVGQTLAPGAGVTIAVQFAPPANGTYNGSLGINSTGGNASLSLTGTAAAAPVLTISPPSLDFGTGAVGANRVMSFNVSNTGGSTLTITKSKPPALGTFVATTALTEGTTIPAGQTLTQTISFAPNAAGTFNDVWVITGDDASGVQNVGFTGVATGGSLIALGEPNILAFDDSGNGNLMVAMPATLAQSAAIQSLSLYVPSGGGKVRLGLYDATGPGGRPGAKRAETVELTSTIGWNTANVTAPVVLPPGTYWLAYLPDNDGLHLRRAGSGTCVYYSFPYAAMPATFSTAPRTDCTDHFSFVAKLNGVTSNNQPPTVATAAAATPSPVTAATTTLSVLGSDDAGESSLVYTWSVAGPAAVSFSANATNAAKSTIATFSKVGSYTFTATVSDAQALTVTSNVTVLVNPTVTSVAIAPGTATVTAGGNQAFVATANDQFGAAVMAQPAFTWTVDGGGTIGASGIFSAGASAGGPFTVRATSGNASGTASVTVSGGGGVDAGASPDAGGAPLVFGETNVLSFDDSDNANLLIAQQATLAQAGTLQSLSFYVSTPAGKLRLAVYDATGTAGRPGIKKAETAEITPGPGWNTANVTAPVALPAGTYWLAYLASDANLHFLRASSGSCYYYGVAYGALPTTFSTNPTSFTSHWSFYGTLNAAGGTNQPPGVATAAAASPNPVSGTTSSLSVLGSDDGGEPGLTYVWATTGTPPGPVTFSANNTNAAKNTVATFTKAGAYSLQATITDAGGRTAVSTATVTVSAVVTSISVAPTSATITPGSTKTFAATAKDQFGTTLASQPAFIWTVSGGGTISPAGVFTAGGTTGGPFTITAASGAKSGTATVTISNNPPTVATAAAASPNPVTGVTSALSVLGADDGGEGNLTYSWATTGTPPGAVTFSANGTNAAKNTVATFTKAGSYALLATITDAQSQTVTSSLTVAVNATMTSIVVTPSTAVVATNGTRAFSASAKDQFGNGLSTQPTFAWSTSGGGTITTTGVFTAGSATGGPFTVTATSGLVNGTATVTINASIVIGTSQILAADDFGNGNLMVAMPASLGQAATIQSLSLYVPSGSGKVRLGIYDATGPGGGPGAKKAETALVTTVVGWNTANVVTPVSLPVGTYWLVYLPDNDNLHIRRSGGGGNCRYFPFAFAAMPATFSTAPSTCDEYWSFYATLQ